MAVEQMRKAAKERLASATKLPDGRPSADIDAARQEHQRAQADWARLDAERIRIETTIPLSEKLLSQLQGKHSVNTAAAMSGAGSCD